MTTQTPDRAAIEERKAVRDEICAEHNWRVEEDGFSGKYLVETSDGRKNLVEAVEVFSLLISERIARREEAAAFRSRIAELEAKVKKKVMPERLMAQGIQDWTKEEQG